MNFKLKIIGSFIFLLSVLFLSCYKDKMENVENLNHNVIMVLGHRGMGVMYQIPGNTAESVMPAIGIGCDGCELDIQMTKDSVLVLFHNKVLDGNTTMSGKVSDYNWDELKMAKYIALKNNVYVQSVESLFDKIPNITNYYFSFDCKIDYSEASSKQYMERLFRAINRFCEKYKMKENIFIEGTYYSLQTAKEQGLTNKFFLSEGDIEERIANADSLGYFGIGCSLPGISVAQVELAHQKGLYVMMWEIGSENDNYQAVIRNVDIVQTDKPISMLKLFDRYNYDYQLP